MIDVTCALIEHEGKVLAVQRSAAMKMPLKWEFPGGKIETGETAEACLLREIAEELELDIEIRAALTPYAHEQIRLIPFVCRWTGGHLRLVEHAQCRWLAPTSLPELDWAPADVEVVAQYLKWNGA